MMQIEAQFSQLCLKLMNLSLKALLETRRQSELSMEGGLDILLQAELQDRKPGASITSKKVPVFATRYRLKKSGMMLPAGVTKRLLPG